MKVKVHKFATSVDSNEKLAIEASYLVRNDPDDPAEILVNGTEFEVGFNKVKTADHEWNYSSNDEMQYTFLELAKIYGQEFLNGVINYYNNKSKI